MMCLRHVKTSLKSLRRNGDKFEPSCSVRSKLVPSMFSSVSAESNVKIYRNQTAPAIYEFVLASKFHTAH
jgi:hypothetical protein